MDNTEQLIAIYHTGFIVCAVLLVVGIALAVLFFFKFDIRTIYMLRTGKAKQQTINEMKERNLKTGKLSASSPYTDSGDLKRQFLPVRHPRRQFFRARAEYRKVHQLHHKKSQIHWRQRCLPIQEMIRCR